MMADLLIGVGSIGAGITGLVWLRHLIRTAFPEVNAIREELARMTTLELHAELTRCAGAIMVCGRKGDHDGVAHARRRIRLIGDEMLSRADTEKEGRKWH